MTPSYLEAKESFQNTSNTSLYHLYPHTAVLLSAVWITLTNTQTKENLAYKYHVAQVTLP